MRSIVPGVLAGVMAFQAAALAQSCVPEWSRDLGGGRPPGWVRALSVWNDGTGPGLFIGTRNGTGTLSKWDGSLLTYHGVFHDEGQDGGLSVLFPHDDGSGESLWGGGSFTEVDGVLAANIARWDGESWRPAGLGTDGGVRAFEVFSDGSGARLYAGGYFTRAGTAYSPGVAAWDGQQWHGLAGGLAGAVVSPPGYVGQTAALALRVFKGKGPRSLYVGGIFTHAGGVACNGVARWDGSAWSPLGAGHAYSGLAGVALALEPFDDSSGESLYVGGFFTAAGGVPSTGIARWDGQSWHPVVTSGVATPLVTALRACDLGQGPRLYGARSNSATASVAQLTPAGWADILGYSPYLIVNALREFDDGNGTWLYACSEQSPGDAGLSRTDGIRWEPMPCEGAANPVARLETLDDGTGLALYATGGGTIAGVSTLPAVRFDGKTWQTVGDTGLAISDLEVFDDGAGPKLYANDGAAGSPMHVSRLVNDQWVGVPGSSAPVVPHSPTRMKSFDDGAGARLFIAGTYEGMVRAWDGQQWTVPGGGVPGASASAHTFDMLVYNGALYLGSSLGVHVYGQGQWGRWSAESLGRAIDLEADGDGPGSTLYGVFDPVGSPAGAVMRYDTSFGTWVFVGPPGASMNGAGAIQWFDDGVRPALYAGGRLGMFGGTGDTLVARWDGVSWSPVAESRMDGGVSSLAVTNFGRPTLWAGGAFAEVNGISSSNIAAYEGCEPCYPDCNRDGALNLADFGCFQARFWPSLDMYPDCNGDGLKNLADFGCFQTRFAVGCP